MAKNRSKDRTRDDARRESGQPGGGQGRRDEVGGSGVYSRSSQDVPDDAVIRTPQQWGQGKRGAAGYEDSGGSELVPEGDQLLGGLTSDASGRPSIDIHGGDRPEQHQGQQASSDRSPASDRERGESNSSEREHGRGTHGSGLGGERMGERHDRKDRR